MQPTAKENPLAPRTDADPATDPYKAYKRKEGTFKTTILSNISFELPDYYEVIDLLGSGAYGHVFAAQDTRLPAGSNAVAIKKVEKAFDNRTFAKRTLREIKILRLMDHENIIKIKEVILPKSRAELNDLYIVYELMETDLGQVIRSGQPLSADHIKFFVYQILRSLKYLHSCKIVHRDLKPRNLLVNSNCDLKLCDFGFARPLNILGCVTEMTDYVVTRWYRAPELLMSHSQYSFGVDMWSVGCIMAELMLKKPLLRGTTTKEQINLVFDLIGTPSEEEIAKIEKEQFRTYVKELQRVPGKDFSKIFKNVEPEAIDFMKQVLKFTPSARLSVEEALEHEYFADLHAPEDEPSGKPVDQAEFEFELYNLNKEQLKDLIFEEILLYHFEDFRKLYSTRKAKGESLTLHVIRNKHADTSKDSEDEEEEKA